METQERMLVTQPGMGCSPSRARSGDGPEKQVRSEQNPDVRSRVGVLGRQNQAKLVKDFATAGVHEAVSKPKRFVERVEPCRAMKQR